MKVLETAKQLGLEFKVAMAIEPFLELARSQPKLALVDLNARAGAVEAITRIRAAGDASTKNLRVIGFLSHVQCDLAAQAQAAGCDEVLPRSTFTQNLAAILSQAKD